MFCGFVALFLFFIAFRTVIGMCLMLFWLICVKVLVIFLSFLKNNLQNIWWKRNFYILLHSLYKTSHLVSYLKHIKKAFFEEIYINREVVQEASVWL